jgi:hypothetical protein
MVLLLKEKMNKITIEQAENLDWDTLAELWIKQEGFDLRGIHGLDEQSRQMDEGEGREFIKSQIYYNNNY